jgi:aspartyl/glutamyl-tRNA(Asn/Gln) amidotransferase C subunit
MKQHEVQQLAELARLKLSDEECKQYQDDFEHILTYIDSISSVDITHHDEQPVTSNIVREDDQYYEPGQYQHDLLAAAPATDNTYIKVNKIL